MKLLFSKNIIHSLRILLRLLLKKKKKIAFTRAFDLDASSLSLSLSLSQKYERSFQQTNAIIKMHADTSDPDKYR